MTCCGNDLVEPDLACPSCGERSMDELVWIDDERVQCARCGTVYEPGKEHHHDG